MNSAAGSSPPAHDDFPMRDFHPSDLDAVKELIDRTVEVSLGPVFSDEIVEFFKNHHNRQSILEGAAAGHAIVLENRGRIAGTGTIPGTEIVRVYIDPGLQGCGLGKRIMARLEQTGRRKGVKTFDLHSTIVSREFYYALGYSLVREASLDLESGSELEYYIMEKKG